MKVSAFEQKNNKLSENLIKSSYLLVYCLILQIKKKYFSCKHRKRCIYRKKGHFTVINTKETDIILCLNNSKNLSETKYCASIIQKATKQLNKNVYIVLNFFCSFFHIYFRCLRDDFSIYKYRKL